MEPVSEFTSIIYQPALYFLRSFQSRHKPTLHRGSLDIFRAGVHARFVILSRAFRILHTIAPCNIYQTKIPTRKKWAQVLELKYLLGKEHYANFVYSTTKSKAWNSINHLLNSDQKNTCIVTMFST